MWAFVGQENHAAVCFSQGAILVYTMACISSQKPNSQLSMKATWNPKNVKPYIPGMHLLEQLI